MEMTMRPVTSSLCLTLMILAAGLPAGCSKDEPATSTLQPRESPTFKTNTGSATTEPAAGQMTSLPAGHPAVGDSGLPPGHPSVAGTTAAPAEAGGEDIGLEIHMPAEFKSKPARMMTL